MQKGNSQGILLVRDQDLAVPAGKITVELEAVKLISSTGNFCAINPFKKTFKTAPTYSLSQTGQKIIKIGLQNLLREKGTLRADILITKMRVINLPSDLEEAYDNNNFF